MLRIDDLDQPRNQPGAEDRILRQLEAHGLEWDERPRRQSEHLAEYADALDRLDKQGLLYQCRCTRAELQRLADHAPSHSVYPGTCRDAGWGSDHTATRIRVGSGRIRFDDACLGPLGQDLAQHVGDFVLRRRDGQYAYQLACAVDEAACGITEVVRGADLVESTFRQIHVMQTLGLAVPRYRHLPVVCQADGRKLSKQNGASPIMEADASRNLCAALRYLGQTSTDRLAGARPEALLTEAMRDWDPDRACQRIGKVT